MYDCRGEALRTIDSEVRHHVHDVVAIGFGPSGLAPAFAIDAHNAADLVTCDGEVVDVRPVIDGSKVVCFEVVGRDGATTRARDVVVATGLTPTLPEGIYSTRRVWHTSELLPRLAALGLERPQRFVVVGAGRSAAETKTYLHERFGDAEICSIVPRDGAASAGPNQRVVDVTDVIESDDDVVAVIRSGTARSDGEISMLRADAIVFATGYEQQDPGRLLGTAAAYCRREANGDLRIGPDGRVQTTSHARMGRGGGRSRPA